VLSERLTASQRYDFAASFQYTAIKTLLQATKKACDEYNPRTCVLAGGVAANTLLRDELQQHLPVPVLLPALPYCTDNAAMIAGLAYYQSRHAEAIDPYKLEAVPTISM
jgi:N6-L-threonylcarbamoyladenine synthase